VARRGVDRVKLGREISAKIRAERSVKWRTKAFAEEVAAYWRDVAWPESAVAGQWPDHPYDTGNYRDSIKVRQQRAPKGAKGGIGGRFLSAFEVYSDSDNANFIEYGTGPDKPGSRSPWGPWTPTPEFAPAARTAHHYGGTTD
jgi:hypothetical protein